MLDQSAKDELTDACGDSFQSHVAFSTFGVPPDPNAPTPPRFSKQDSDDRAHPEPPRGPAVVKNNTLSMTLNFRHKGYHMVRRSRTFMAGFDHNEYSKYALQWLLNELVDDGDEVVCVHVVDKEFRFERDAIKSYEQEAAKLMRRITELNESNRAISIVLEYVFGKLQTTFQRLIRMYQPGMLIVGTRGRSLGGLQGLVNTRTSFSKYCLQYSPVPVVVVRPTDKRMKKRDKRAVDGSRRTYASMLRSTGGKHETDIAAANAYQFETSFSADEEAHHVASVLGLPAAFDPTVKPIDPASLLRHGHNLYIHSIPPSAAPSAAGSQAGSQPPSPTGSGPGDSDDEEDEEEEGEFEVTTGEQALAMTEQKKEKLHAMEMNEAAALKLHGELGEEDDD
jgi:nucleotide-binding universal stress UspA family protein